MGSRNGALNASKWKRDGETSGGATTKARRSQCGENSDKALTQGLREASVLEWTCSFS